MIYLLVEVCIEVWMLPLSSLKWTFYLKYNVLWSLLPFGRWFGPLFCRLVDQSVSCLIGLSQFPKRAAVTLSWVNQSTCYISYFVLCSRRLQQRKKVNISTCFCCLRNDNKRYVFCSLSKTLELELFSNGIVLRHEKMVLKNRAFEKQILISEYYIL